MGAYPTENGKCLQQGEQSHTDQYGMKTPILAQLFDVTQCGMSFLEIAQLCALRVDVPLGINVLLFAVEE